MNKMDNIIDFNEDSAIVNQFIENLASAKKKHY